MFCYVITLDYNFAYAVKDAGIYDGIQTIYEPNTNDTCFNSYIYSMTTDTYDKILDARESLYTSDWYCVFENQCILNNTYNGSVKDRELVLYQNDLTILNIYNNIMTDIVNKYGWTDIYWCPQSLKEVPQLFIAGIMKNFLYFDNFHDYVVRMFDESNDYNVFSYLLAVAKLNNIPIIEMIKLL